MAEPSSQVEPALRVNLPKIDLRGQKKQPSSEVAVASKMARNTGETGIEHSLPILAGNECRKTTLRCSRPNYLWRAIMAVNGGPDN